MNKFRFRTSCGSTVANTFGVTDTSGVTQTNRVVSTGRIFKQGEIAQYAQASVNGTPVTTQCDVKNRWPDGSLKFAIISFVIPSLTANSTATILLSNQSTGNNTGYLDQTAILSTPYNFDATIQMVNSVTRTVSARTILSASNFRYWLQGPIVTAVIIEDRTSARTYDTDFGDTTKSLHPIFEAWFYPQGNKVEVGYTIENCWISSTAANGMHDETYSLTLKSGNSSPTTEYTQSSFTHIGRSRWHKRYWLGADPGSIRINHNTQYLISTGAIPNYDLTVIPTETLIANKYTEWLASEHTLVQGNASGIGLYNKTLSAPGAADWIGLLNTWDTMYLLTMDDRMQVLSQGHTDLAGRIPWHYREADHLAGTGDFFDTTTTGSVETLGKVVSINARQTISLSDFSASSQCQVAYDPDRASVPAGLITDQPDNWVVTRDHMPDTAYLTYMLQGRYYYLEELQMQTAYVLASRVGCVNDNPNYVDRSSRYGNAGYLNDAQTRGDAWGFRTLAYGAFLSPDSTPEKAYFEDKLQNNIAFFEGWQNTTLSYPAKQSHYTRVQANAIYDPSPLGEWDYGPKPPSAGAMESPIKQDGTIEAASTNWEESFLICALGMARQFGYQTDNLLRFMAKVRLHIILDSASLKYLIDKYRWPARLTSTHNWLTTQTQFVNGFETPLPTAWQAEGTIDHGYGVIALAAASYLIPYTVDGYTGQQAWDAWYTDKMAAGNPTNHARFSTESPKWAITTPSSTPSSGTLPFSLSIGQWWTPPDTSLSRISDVYNTPNPGGTQSSIIDAWAGGAFDTLRKDYLISNGGHGDYGGNEVYAFNCDPNSPNFLTWRRKSLSSTAPFPNSSETYPDGSPCQVHTYCTQDYHPNLDKLIRTPGGFTWSGASTTKATWGFACGTESPNVATPAAYTRYDDLVFGGAYGSNAIDSVTGKVYCYLGGGLRSIDFTRPAGSQWTIHTSGEGGQTWEYNMTALITQTSPKYFITVGSRGAPGDIGYTQIRRLDTFAFIDSSVGATVTGATSCTDVKAPGAFWSNSLQKVVLWSGTVAGGTDNRDWYTFDPVTKVYARQSGTGDIPTSPVNGIGTFSRLRPIGGGVAMVCNSTTNEVHFFRYAATET